MQANPKSATFLSQIRAAYRRFKAAVFIRDSIRYGGGSIEIPPELALKRKAKAIQEAEEFRIAWESKQANS